MSALLASMPVLVHAAAPQLGRLFLSPAERGALDLQRDPPPQTEAAPASAAPPAALAEPVLLNGLVKRSSGKSTAWLNDAPQNDGNNTLNKNQTLTLQLSNGRKVILKPGQRFDPNHGSVSEDHEP
ncbi:hypothetical protein [Janthinobacterium agaricidamnosum]|nr:hypothetical protein [Janthinobacterium agaricidamnosum]